MVSVTCVSDYTDDCVFKARVIKLVDVEICVLVYLGPYISDFIHRSVRIFIFLFKFNKQS